MSELCYKFQRVGSRVGTWIEKMASVVKIPKLMGKGLLIIAIPAIFQLIFGVSLAMLEARAEKAQKVERHSKEVLLILGSIESACYDVTLEVLRLSVEKSVRVMRTINAACQTLEASENTLTKLVENDVEQSAHAATLKVVLIDFVNGTNRIIEAIKENNQLALTMAGLQMRNRALRFGAGEEQISLMRGVEEARLAANPIQTEQTQLILQMLMIGLICSTLVSIASAAYFLRDIVFRLYSISKNAELISLGEEMKPAMQGTDEIAKLDRMLHRMASNLIEASRRETALVSNAADVILCIDKSLMISSINKAAETQWNYTEDDLLHKRIMHLVPAESQDEVHRFLSSARNTRHSESADIPIICKNETVKTFSWNVLWSPEEDLLFCVAHDVSELRRVEHAKRDFVNMVSHDIRTPLSGMAIFLEMIPMGVYGELNDSGKSRASSLGSALNRIVVMVNDLLDIEKMQSGQFQIFKTNVDGDSLVKASLEMVQGFAEQQMIKIESQSTGGMLLCDEARIIQVLQNLLSNAIKFSDAGKTVILKLERQEDVTRFEVTDNGRGIAKDDIPALFERFTQAKGDDSKRQSGFGLGLAICKDIVERHGGSIGIMSELGKGSTFWFTIPNSETEAPA